MKKILKLTHNWLGFFLSIIMLIVLSTGIYLGTADLINRLDDKTQHYFELTNLQKANIVDHAFNTYPKAQGVKLPTPQSPFVEVYSREKSVFLTKNLIEIETHIKQKSELQDFIFWLHRDLQLGKFGKSLNAIAALLTTIIIFIGIYLWWLIRKGFRIKQSFPKNTKNSSLVKSHIQLGVIFSIPLLIMAFSGFYITYGIRGGDNGRAAIEKTYVGQANNWQSQVEQALSIWPQAQLVSVSKPRKRRGSSGNKEAAVKKDLVYQINFNTDKSAWLQQTDTIKINLHTSELVYAKKFLDKGLAYQAIYLARFLHDGARMPTWYLILLIVSSIIGMMMVCFGMVTFIRKNVIKNRQAVLKRA